MTIPATRPTSAPIRPPVVVIGLLRQAIEQGNKRQEQQSVPRPNGRLDLLA